MKKNNYIKKISILSAAFCFFSIVSPAQLTTRWTQVHNLTTTVDAIFAANIGSNALYVCGYNQFAAFNNQWVIQKRDLTTGAPIAAFGVGGTVTSNPSASDDRALALASNSGGLYIAGVENGQWRLEKRDLNSGTLISGFGVSGIISTNPSAGFDEAMALAIDATGIYIAGHDASPGNDQWKIGRAHV